MNIYVILHRLPHDLSQFLSTFVALPPTRFTPHPLHHHRCSIAHLLPVTVPHIVQDTEPPTPWARSRIFITTNTKTQRLALATDLNLL